jgi:hypothetical protein
VFRLVSSGHGAGLTGWGMLNAMPLDVVLDFSYGIIVENADKDQRAEIDRSLAELDEPSATKMVEIVKRDGTVVQVTEKRLAEIRSNVASISQMKRR